MGGRRQRGGRRWHAALLPHGEVKTWYENLARRDAATADDYLRRLGRNLDAAIGKSPVDLLSMTQANLDEAATACIAYMFKQGLAGSTVNAFYVTLKSFLKWHRRALHRDIAIPGADDYLSAENETIPDQAALRRVMQAAEVRTAAMIAVVAQGGQRLQVLGNENASDGLRLRDLRGMTITPDDVTFEATPLRVDVGRSLSKNGKPFFFFLGKEACESLRAYLRTRIRGGETLEPDSPLFRPYGGAPRFLLRNNVGDSIRRAMQTANVPGRPYVWRSYYSHHCQLAEPQGFLEAWRKFYMGHKGNIQTTYGTRKQGLPIQSVEQMRQAYAKALPFLETTGTANAPDPMRRLTEAVLKAGGSTAGEVAKLDLDAMDETAVVRLLMDTMSKRTTGNNGAGPSAAVHKLRQKVVTSAELPTFLDQGWVFRSLLEGGKVVVESAA